MADDPEAKDPKTNPDDPQTGEHTAPYPPPTPLERPQAWSDTDEPPQPLPESPHPSPPVVDRPDPVEPLVADPEPEAPPSGRVDTSTVVIEKAPEPKPDLSEPAPEPIDIGDALPAQPVVVPGTVHNLRRWVLLVSLLGVWIPAAIAGLAAYQWWYDTPVRSVPLFVAAVYVLATTTAALLLAMVDHKPWVSSMSIAVLTAPFASTTAAAALHAAYAFGWVSP